MTLAYTSPFQTFPHLYLPSIIHTHSYYIMLPSNHLLVWAKSYNTISWEICCISKLRFLASFKHSLGWFQVGITDQPPTWRTKNHLRKSNPRIFEDLSNPAPLAGPNPQSPRRWWSCDEAGRLSPQKSKKKLENWRERFRKLSLFGPSGFFFEFFLGNCQWWRRKQIFPRWTCWVIFIVFWQENFFGDATKVLKNREEGWKTTRVGFFNLASHLVVHAIRISP